MANVQSILVTEDFILDFESYTPRGGGPRATRYEVAPGAVVSLRKVTPELVREYDALARKKGKTPKSGEEPADPEDTRSSHDIALERVRVVTEGAPAGFEWNDCSMSVLWRIVEDFLFLSGPILGPREQYSKK